MGADTQAYPTATELYDRNLEKFSELLLLYLITTSLSLVADTIFQIDLNVLSGITHFSFYEVLLSNVCGLAATTVLLYRALPK